MVQDVNIVYAYVDQQGRCPYEVWLNLLKDAKAKAAIISRIDRMAQ